MKQWRATSSWTPQWSTGAAPRDSIGEIQALECLGQTHLLLQHPLHHCLAGDDNLVNPLLENCRDFSGIELPPLPQLHLGGEDDPQRIDFMLGYPQHPVRLQAGRAERFVGPIRNGFIPRGSEQSRHREPSFIDAKAYEPNMSQT